jgi:ADP-ribosyl-[dinitrogen reductase] hydrolase
VGLTFCPGKVQPHGATGAWRRDLRLDLDAVAAWGAVAVVTLVEDHELAALQVPALGAEVAARHMEWLHLPIPDGGAPGAAFEATWGDGERGRAGGVHGGLGGGVGEGLRARLRDGFSVLVHCKGGLGRAGTVAARLLVELGVSPPEAVRQVREVRPGAIETPEQLAHVMGLHAVPEPEPATTAEVIRDRAVGCLLGLAVGDAVGTTLEFRARDTYPPLTDMVGGGPFGLRPGQWTDDTAMALALADSLAAHPHLDEHDLMARFVDWHERGTYSCTGTCFDIGATTRAALARYKRTGNPVAGSTDPRSAGNGSLMRLAPVAVRHWRNRATLRDVAARQSRTTHAAPEAVDACVAYAELLADAIAGQRRSEVMRGRADVLGMAASFAAAGAGPGTDGSPPRSTPLAGAIGPILAGSWRGKPRSAISASGYVAHSLEAALRSVGSTGSFRSAALRAANLGEDADTTAAVAGQLAGALYGASGIPEAWRGKVAWGDRIK